MVLPMCEMVSRLRPERIRQIRVCRDEMVCKPSPRAAPVTGRKCQTMVSVTAMFYVVLQEGPAPTSHRHHLPSHLTLSNSSLARDQLLPSIPSSHRTQTHVFPPTYLAISHSCSMWIPLFWELMLLLTFPVP